MANKTEKYNDFINLEEMDEEDSDVDRATQFFASIPQSTPVKTRPDLASTAQNDQGRSFSRQLSLSEGDLSTSVGNLDISVDERSPQKKRLRAEIGEATFDRLETPIYCKHSLSNDEIIGLLVVPDSIDQSKICGKIPVAPPGKGQWTFVVNLEKVEVRDLQFDSMGSWGVPSGRAWYYQNEGDIANCISKKNMPTDNNWDFRVKSNRYNHPGAKRGTLAKTIFVSEKRDKTSNCQFAVIYYESSVLPSEVRIVANKKAKDQERPMPRTKPSVLHKQRQLLTSHTPLQVNRVLLQEAGGVSSIYSPVDVPANQQQIRNQSRKVPDSKRTTGSGRPAMNRFEEIEKMMSHAGSFVMAIEYVPATESSQMGILVFLADRRGLEVAQKFSLTTTTPAQLHRSLKMDMSYEGVNGFYITPVNIRDPRFFNNETAKPPLLTACLKLNSMLNSLQNAHSGMTWYYYISYELLRRDPLLTLEPEHEQLMIEQFNVANLQPATENWRDIPIR